MAQTWAGRCWVNPPYGNQTGTWLQRLSAHGNGIALIFARTETKMFHQWVWQKADAVFFFAGRLTFHNLDGSKASNSAGASSALVAFGGHNVAAIQAAIDAGNLKGKLIILKHP